MWSESLFPATLRYRQGPHQSGPELLSVLRLSVRLVMKMSVILCNVM